MNVRDKIVEEIQKTAQNVADPEDGYEGLIINDEMMRSGVAFGLGLATGIVCRVFSEGFSDD